MSRVRTTQEMLDSRLMLTGWRVYIDTDAGRSYATGAGTWTPDKRRAFLFTDAPHSARKGNDDGRRWAWNHARHLVGLYTKSQWDTARAVQDMGGEYEYGVLKPRVVCIRHRIYPLVARSTGRPGGDVQSEAEKGTT